jgi:hypothetical protein
MGVKYEFTAARLEEAMRALDEFAPSPAQLMRIRWCREDEDAAEIARADVHAGAAQRAEPVPPLNASCMAGQFIRMGTPTGADSLTDGWWNRLFR